MLKLDKVCFHYTENKRVFENVSLTIQKNDLVLLRGRSGTGKSTFLKLLNRFHLHNSGSITLHKKEIAHYPIQELRSRLLYLPQLPAMVPGSLKENLSFPFSLAVYGNKQFDIDRAKEWMDYFQLSASWDDDAHTLSVGEKQRLALVRALLLEPEMLLLDEPTSALDKENRMLIEKKIESLVEEGRITVVLVTHQESGFSSNKLRSYKLSRKNLLPVEGE